MKFRFVRLLQWITAVVLIAGTAAASAQETAIVVDSKGEIYGVNILCDLDPECTDTLERLTDEKLKKGNSVALFRNESVIGAFIGSEGKKGEVLLLVESDPDWDVSAFLNKGVTAAVVTRDGTAYFAKKQKNGPAIIQAHSQGDPGTGIAGYLSAPDSIINPVEFDNGVACGKIVGLEAPLANPDNLIVICDNPGGVIAVDTNGPISFQTLVDPNSLGTRLSDGAMVRVMTNGDFTDYLVLSARSRELIAVDPVTGNVQRNLLIGQGNIRGVTAAQCAVGGEIVPCGAFTQSGGSGQWRFFTLQFESAYGELVATIQEQVSQGLKNPYGTDLKSLESIDLGDCALPEGCLFGNNVTLQLNFDDAPMGEAAVETLGPFFDPCDGMEHSFGETEVEVLQNFSAGPEICAEDGYFVTEINSGFVPDPNTGGFGISILQGQQCWEPGIDDDAATEPTFNLDEVMRTPFSGDPLDLSRIDGTDVPILAGVAVASIYVDSENAGPGLVGCETRVRMGSRFTFGLEGYFGDDLMAQLGDKDTPLVQTTPLYEFGIREFTEAFDLLLDSPHSGCFGGPLGPCQDFGEALAQGLFGWQIQRSSGLAEDVSIVPDQSDSGKISEESFTAFVGTENVDVNVKALISGNDGKLGNRTVALVTGVGVGADTGTGDIHDNQLIEDTGEAITVDFSTSIEGFDVADIPMVIKSFEAAFLYSSEEEVLVVTATTSDGDKIVGWLKAFNDGMDEKPIWILDPGGPMEVMADAFSTGTVGDPPTGDGRIRSPMYPFGETTLVTELRFETSSTPPTCMSFTCDGSLLSVEIEIPPRIDNLGLSFNGLANADCGVSSRPDFDFAYAGLEENRLPSRPKLCGMANGPHHEDFNTPSGAVTTTRNMTGIFQTLLEAFMLFESHNICELDYLTEIDPGEVGFLAGSFCKTPLEQSLRPEQFPAP